MLVYESHARVEASPQRVWEVLTDAARYTEWDNGVVEVRGTMADGNRITVVSEINPKRSFPVRVGDWQPARGMTWTGGMPMGLFVGVRTFTLREDGDGTDFHMREEFSGPLLKVISRTMPDLQPSFDQFTAGLKAEAERG